MKNSNSNTRIRALINELGISQTEFCNKTGIKKSALSNYLNGDRQPRQDQLDKIAKSFNINPSWLMGYDVPMSAEEIAVYEAIAVRESMSNDDALKKRMGAYYQLFRAADGCSKEQIELATQMLKNFKKVSKEE